MPDNEELVCGMALGYADNDAVANRLTTERESLDVGQLFWIKGRLPQDTAIFRLSLKWRRHIDT